MNALTRRTRVLTAVAAVAVTAAAVLVVGPGYHDAQVRLRAGTVWLASTATGGVTLVDGASAEVAGGVEVGEPGSALSVTQRGSAALVLNQETGVLSRVDSATQRVSATSAVLPASPGLTVKSAPDAVHAVDVHSGTVTSVDPDTLKAGEPRRLAGEITPDNLVVDDRGRLWAIDEESGDLVWLTDGGERRTRATATRTGRLTLTADQPALVDPEHGTAELLSPETGAVTRTARTGLGAGDAVVVGGSADRSRLLIAVPGRGELVTCAFDTGSCADPVRISAPGAELGTPVEVDDHAVVPDRSTGQVTIVNLDTGKVVAQRQLFGQPTRFELLARDGIVFFNDPDSNAAGVLDLAGDVRAITKYAEGPTMGENPPVPDPRSLATKIDNRQQPGVGLPGRDWTPQTNPPRAPAPAVAIVVRPGTRGVVGDEFDLSVQLHPAGTATTQWSFGDGTEAAGNSVRHRWQQPGSFLVRAAVTRANGKTTHAEATVTVDPAGAPHRITQLTVRRPKPVIGESVHFNADTVGKPDKWAWTVTRPGQPAPEITAQTPEFSHRFATPGVYTVALTTTAGGQPAQFSKQFTVARGAVKVWGMDNNGETQVPPLASSGVVAVSGGNGFCLALKSDGSVLAWGRDWWGETKVPASAMSGVVAISAGGGHSLALKSDGTVVFWGFKDHQAPSVPMPDLRNIVAIAAGENHSLALRANGSVVAWGGDLSGQSQVPAEATSGVVAIAAGRSHSLALKSDGSLISWGQDNNPELQIPPAAKHGVAAIAAGDNRSVVLKRDGSIIQWGHQWEQEPGIPPAAQNGVVALSLSNQHYLALKPNGTVLGWGNDNEGSSTLPPQYDGSVLAVSAAYDFSMAIVEGLD